MAAGDPVPPGASPEPAAQLHTHPSAPQRRLEGRGARREMAGRLKGASERAEGKRREGGGEAKGGLIGGLGRVKGGSGIGGRGRVETRLGEG